MRKVAQRSVESEAGNGCCEEGGDWTGYLGKAGRQHLSRILKSQGKDLFYADKFTESLATSLSNPLSPLALKTREPEESL